MISVMIVDDEQIVIDGLTFLLNQAFKTQITVVGTARSGREAIAVYETCQADVIMMDIQMPGINGLEAIKTIRMRHQKVKCIIISAYEQFEYAKQAVEIGAVEYILKPIHKNSMIEVMQRVIAIIEQEKKMQLKEIENQEKLEKVLPILENGFIYSILMNQDYTGELIRYQGLFHMEKECGFMMVIEISDTKVPSAISNRIGTGVKGMSHYERVRNAIKYKSPCIIGPWIMNRMTVLFYEENTQREYDQRTKAVSLAEQIHDVVEDIVERSVFIGIGSCYPIERIQGSYIEAVKALSKITDEKVLHIKDAIEVKDPAVEYAMMAFKSDELRLIKGIEEGKHEHVKLCMHQIFERFLKTFGEINSTVKHMVIEMLVLMHNVAYGRLESSETVAPGAYLAIIDTIERMEDLEQYCLNQALSITAAIAHEKEEKVSHVIQKSMAFIDQYYNTEIGLKEVSEAVAISPQYFSKVFKNEIGINFIDYLTHVRMGQAKRLLEQQELSIKEIAFAVGYHDPNYFSRLFKKVEGVSPTEFLPLKGV